MVCRQLTKRPQRSTLHGIPYSLPENKMTKCVLNSFGVVGFGARCRPTNPLGPDVHTADQVSALTSTDSTTVQISLSTPNNLDAGSPLYRAYDLAQSFDRIAQIEQIDKFCSTQVSTFLATSRPVSAILLTHMTDTDLTHMTDTDRTDTTVALSRSLLRGGQSATLVSMRTKLTVSPRRRLVSQCKQPL